jgi:50S ribosomal protein L16 3-hydroxylase
MKRMSVLGDLTPREFLRSYWQKKPVLIRQALPQFAPVLSRDALFALAARDDVEARLITHFGAQWKLSHGPLTALPATTRKGWTILVQGVNLHDDAADALLSQFRFIPDARLDDLMISYATDTGGVGPHLDSYDVFLLQAEGRRRWRIGRQTDRSLIEGAPIKLLRHFTPTHEYLLEPGDMLYLPPQWGHEGVAVGECMTYSIGFRAPTWQELGEAYLGFLAEQVDLSGRYRDKQRAPELHPARLGNDLLQQARQQLGKLGGRPQDVLIFLGEYLSEPKPSVWFAPVERPVGPARFGQLASQRGLRLSRQSRMLFRDKYIFINGESLRADGKDRLILQAFADERSLPPGACAGGSGALVDTLYDWYRQGWLKIA